MICLSCGKFFEKEWRKDLRHIKKYPLNYCSRECSNKRNHSENTKNKIKDGILVYLKKNNKNIIGEIFCKECGIKITNKPKYGFCKNCFAKTQMFKDILAKLQAGLAYAKKYNNLKTGAYREGSGNGKCGYYKGYYCASTWELAYIIYLIDNKISFIRNTEKFEYIKKDGTKSWYIPDFMVDGKFIEIKGPQDKNWEEKLKYFPYKDTILILHKKDMLLLIEEAKKKNGINDLSLLYEDVEKKYCKVCNKLLYRKNKSGYCRYHVKAH
jgi:hypothetical protein